MTLAEIADGAFRIVVALLAAASLIIAARIAKRGKDKEAEQAALMAAEAREQEDRKQRFEELNTSLAAARQDLKYYAEQLSLARTEVQAGVDRAAKIVELERRIGDIERDKEAAFEQADMLSQQLDEERETNKLLRAQLAATLAELDAAKQQIAILSEHAKRVDDWWHLLLRQNGNIKGATAPPQLTTFDLPVEEPT